MDVLNRFQDFLNRSLLVDQTQLVNELIKEDRQLEYHNRQSFSTILSDGNITGTQGLISDMLKTQEYELRRVDEKLHIFSDDKVLMQELKETRIALVRDIEALKSAEGHYRPVLQWLLVSYWLSDQLIQYGEVVLRHGGCCFWGISSHKDKPFLKEGVLSDIFEELNH